MNTKKMLLTSVFMKMFSQKMAKIDENHYIDPRHQGDQIGRIFAFGAIVYVEQIVLKIT
jgi:hypothetical protein